MSNTNFYRDRLDAKSRQSHIDYFGEHLSVNEREAIPLGDNIPSVTNKIITKVTTDAIEADVLELQTTSKITSGTPVNAIAAVGLVTFLDTVTQGELIAVGADVYEVDIDAAGITPGNIPITLVTGAVAKTDSGIALVAAQVASGTEAITFVDNADGTVTMTSDVKGVSGNLIALLATGAQVSVDAAFMDNTVIGVNGTIGDAGITLYDLINLYIATEANTISDDNWKKLTLLSL
jgi:hypothetical protein